MTLDTVEFGPASASMIDSTSYPESVSVMGDGTVRQRIIGVETRILEVAIPRLTYGDAVTLRSMLRAAKRYSLTMALVDDYGTAYTVRPWGPEVRFETRIGRIYSTRLQFRIEN